MYPLRGKDEARYPNERQKILLSVPFRLAEFEEIFSIRQPFLKGDEFLVRQNGELFYPVFHQDFRMKFHFESTLIGVSATGSLSPQGTVSKYSKPGEG